MNKPLNLSEDLNRKWQDLGYTPGTLRLLFLIPPIQTAWAEGYMQAAESRKIIDFAKNELGIRAEDSEFADLKHWLKIRPTDKSFELMNEILSDLLNTIPKPEGKFWRDRILRFCLEVAQASQEIGFLGKNNSPVNQQESLQIEKLGRLLNVEPI